MRRLTLALLLVVVALVSLGCKPDPDPIIGVCYAYRDPVTGYVYDICEPR